MRIVAAVPCPIMERIGNLCGVFLDERAETDMAFNDGAGSRLAGFEGATIFVMFIFTSGQLPRLKTRTAMRL